MSCVTGVFFFATRDVYGAIAFDNFLGLIGVTQAIRASWRIANYESPQAPLLAMAAGAGGVLVPAHWLWLPPRPSGR